MAEIEAELKFVLTPAEAAALRRPGAVDDLAVGGRETVVQHSTYFDTADHALRRAGLSLRVRRRGDGLEQTVKRADRPLGALAERHEDSAAVPAETPDLDRIADADLRAAVREAIGGTALSALFTVRVERTTRMIVTAAGDEIEYAVDDGEIVAGDRRAAIAEAEFELKGGDRRALFGVARQAMAAVPVRFSDIPKSERGYRLADGADDGPPAPVRAEEPALSADDSVEIAFRAILRSCFAQIAANVAVVLAGDDPEGPHQLRVGLRRLRTAFRIFGKVADRAATARLADETRRLAAAVGELRDLDVFAEEIVAPCAERIDVAGLAAVLAARRAHVRGALLDRLAGPATGGFLIDLAAYVEGRGWLSTSDVDQTAALAEPVGDFAERAIHRLWTKVARRGRHLDDLSTEDRHALRKAFKGLRYGLDFFGPLLGARDRRRALRDVKAAQDVLGYLNDVATAARMTDVVRAAPDYATRGDRGDIDRALGFCLGWHEARAVRVWEESKALVALDPHEL